MKNEIKHPLISCLELALATLKTTSKDRCAKAAAAIECAMIIAKHKPVALPQLNNEIPDCSKCSGMAIVSIACSDCGASIVMPEKESK